MCTKNHNHMMHGSWDTEWDRQNFLSFWTSFCPFTLLRTWKSKFCKNEKKHLKILSFYKCVYTINDGYMMYGSWAMECNRQNFLSFRTIFCTFTSLTARKIKILKKWKLPGDIILHRCNINYNHMMYGSWDTECNRQFFVILDHLLHFYSPIFKIKILKNWKKHLEILSFYTCVS